MSPTPDGNTQVLGARKPDGIHDIGHSSRTGDQSRPLVDESVVHLSRYVVTHVAWLKQLAAKCLCQFTNGADQG
jgi:hypothetical protein